MRYLAFSFVLMVLFLYSCHNDKTDSASSSESQTEIQDTLSRTEGVPDKAEGTAEANDSINSPERKITEDMAYKGVNNYCHKNYDWSVAKENPSIMYVTMGEETESEYEVIFRSYTGAFVHFYVDKKSGTTRMVERVPTLDIEEEAGTFNLFDMI